jgi:hypothetical protein
MIVSNFNLVRIGCLPPEADAPLVVDPHAPLAAAVAPEGFQSVARKGRQVPQLLGIMQHSQLPQGYSLHAVIQSPRESAMPEALGLFGGEAGDHRSKLWFHLYGVNFCGLTS